MNYLSLCLNLLITQLPLLLLSTFSGIVFGENYWLTITVHEHLLRAHEKTTGSFYFQAFGKCVDWVYFQAFGKCMDWVYFLAFDKCAYDYRSKICSLFNSMPKSFVCFYAFYGKTSSAFFIILSGTKSIP